MKACQILKVSKTKGVCNNEGYWILQTQTHIHTHTHTHTHTQKNPLEMSNYMNYLRTPQTSSGVFCFLSPFWWVYHLWGRLSEEGLVCVDINESQEKRTETLLIFLVKTQMYLQIYILSPLKHLRWTLFQKQLPKTPLDV